MGIGCSKRNPTLPTMIMNIIKSACAVKIDLANTTNLAIKITDRGIGVINVNNRIRLSFGPEYGLHYYSEPGKGTRVEAWLPLLEGNRREKDV